LPNSTFQQSPDKPFGQDKALEASKVEEFNKLAFGLAWLSRDLYLKGFNIVQVDKDKRPLLSWSWESRPSWGEIEEVLKRRFKELSGLAVIAGPENPKRPLCWLVIVDIDDPRALGGLRALMELVETSVSWRTGPRCPRCYDKQHIEVLEPGRLLRCPKCVETFKAEEAPRGLGVMFYVSSDLVEKYLKGTVRGKGVELLVRNYQVIPPSIHKTGVAYEWIRPLDFSKEDFGIRTLTEEELLELLKEIGAVKEVRAEVEERRSKKLRELNDTQLLKVKELLKPAYLPGNRQFMWLFLSGYGAKAGISPISIAKLLKMLYEETGDGDDMRTRASALVYSYKKAGIDLEPYAEELKQLLGVEPYGLEREISEAEVKGKTGLQEVLESVLGEERALEVLRELEENFGVASPYKDSIIELLDFEAQLYAVANLRKLITARARRREDESGSRLVYKERVAIGAPTDVVVFFNPIGGITKYQVKWEVSTRPRPIVIGPCLLEEIVDRLKAEGLITCSRLASDVIAAIIEGFIRRRRATVKTELETPGFYYLDGKLVAVGYQVEEPSRGELRRALELLNEIATKWFERVLDRFATVIKWWVLAPFDYVIKQMGAGYLPGLYQYGPPNTGKSTLNRIGQAMWGFKYPEIASEDYEIPGSSTDNPARLEHWISRGTFPICIKEPRAIFENPVTVEMVKSAMEGLIARGKYRRGGYSTAPSLANLSFTSNTYLPSDPSLIGKRLFVVKYSYGEVLNPDRGEDRDLMNRFEREVLPRLGELSPIGKHVASKVFEAPELLRRATWVGNSWLDVAEELLRGGYEDVGLEPPAWLRERSVVESMTEAYEDKRESIRVFLVKRINEEYSRSVGRVLVEMGDKSVSLERSDLSLEERAKVVLEKRLIPWLILKGGTVYATTGLVKELERELRDDMGGLKSIAEMLGWDYEKKHHFREGKEERNVSVAYTSIEDFLAFLTAEPT
jgi:hypothetical protein